MASDVGGYISGSGQGSERRSFDENDRKKVAMGKRFAKLTLSDKQPVEFSPMALRLEPWGKIPEPPKDRHEYLKTLLGQPNHARGWGKLLGGDIAHHEHPVRSVSPAPSGLSRSTTLSRTLSRIGEKATPKISVSDCFKRFTSVETLDGDNKFACEECAKVLYS